MSIEKIDGKISAPRKVKISELRSRRIQDRSNEWTTDNLRVLAEPEEKALQNPSRGQRLKDTFKYSQNQKANYDMGKSLANVAASSAAEKAKKAKGGNLTKEQKQKRELDFRNQIDGVFSDALGEKKKGTSAKEIGLNTNKIGDKDKTATIGSFNIEWLGQKQRTQADYKEIANVIKDSKASLLGIQEVANEDGLKSLMKHLPGYGYVLGKSGQQMTGMIFDKKRVKYDANSIDHVEEAMAGNPRLRPPFSVDVKVDNYDFNFTVLHLKAGFKDKAIKTRNVQADAINKWMKEKQAKSKDKDMIIVGDYNDFNNSPTLNRIDKGDTVDYVTDGQGKDFYTNIRYKSVIDHAALSKAPGGAAEDYVKGSLRTIDESKYPDYAHRVSDHKPIFFDMRTGEDND